MTNYSIFDSLDGSGMSSMSISPQSPRSSSFFGKISPETLNTISTGLSIGGALSSAISAYYSVKSQKIQAESQASYLEFKQSMSQIEARSVERYAMDLFRRGQQLKALASLKMAQEKATIKARQGASGVRVGVGSNAEILASEDFAKDLDLAMIDSNTLRQVQSARNQKLNVEMAGESYSLNASNIRDAASAASPSIAAFTSFLNSSGNMIDNEISRQGKSRVLSEYYGG